MRWRDAPILSAALFAGVVHAASFWPFSAWWLQVLALAALVTLVLRDAVHPVPATRRACKLRGAWIGFAFGFGWFVTGVSWVYVSMHRYGGMPAPLAALALLLFAAFLALIFSCVTGVLASADRAMRRRAASPSARVASLALLFAGLWSFAEIARGWLFTGFPWLAIGYAHVDGPLAAFAPVFGVYGISTLAALSAFGIGAALSRPGHAADRPDVRGAPGHRGRNDAVRPSGGAPMAIAVACAVVPPLAGAWLPSIEWSLAHGTPLRVRLVQGNVPQEMKFDPQRALQAMSAYVDQVVRTDAALTVLPETAWTVPWSRTPAALHERLTAHLADTGGVVAIGMPLIFTGGTSDAAATPEAASNAHAAVAAESAMPMLSNSVAVIDRSGEIVSRYDKRHLVPFGEFVPFGFGWFVDLMQIPLGEFARGSSAQAAVAIGDQRIAFDICFEDLFGEELAAQVRGGATVLVNVSNIAWFGDSHALPQHLQISRMRSIELARPMLRATNTGVTAAIDADGRVLGRLPAYAAGSLDVQVQGRDGLTPYARIGNASPLALAALLTGAGAFGSLRRARRASVGATQTR